MAMEAYKFKWAENAANAGLSDSCCLSSFIWIAAFVSRQEHIHGPRSVQGCICICINNLIQCHLNIANWPQRNNESSYTWIT